MKINEKYALILAFAVLLSFTAYSYAQPVQPDLTVTDITFLQLAPCTPNSTNNATVTVGMEVKNTGNATAPNFTDRLNIAGVNYYFNAGPLATGETITHTKAVSRKCGVQFAVNATTDFYNNVAESNELNNNRVEFYTP